MHILTHLSTISSLVVSRKSLLFLCLSVASVVFFAIPSSAHAIEHTRYDTYSNAGTCNASGADIWLTIDASVFDNNTEILTAVTLGMSNNTHGWNMDLYEEDGTTFLVRGTPEDADATTTPMNAKYVQFAEHTRPAGEGYKIYLTTNNNSAFFYSSSNATFTFPAGYSNCSGFTPAGRLWIDDIPVPPPAITNFVYLPSIVVSSTTPGVSTQTIVHESLSGTGTYVHDYFVKSMPTSTTPTGDASIPNSIHCYPRTGGTSGMSTSTTFNLVASVNQTSNTSGGSPACNVSGTYYHFWWLNDHATTAVYYATYEYNASSSTFEPQDDVNPNRTYVVSLDPSNETIATSTTAVLSTEVHVAPGEYEEGMYARMTWYRQTNQVISVVGASQPSFGLDSGVRDFSISNYGRYTFSTTTAITSIGVYFYKVEIVYPQTILTSIVEWFSFGTSPEEQGLVKHTTFTAATTTGIDELYADPDYVITGGTFGNLIENLDLESCSFFSGDFSVLDCLKLLIFPPTTTLLAVWENLMDNTLRVFPLGYITRFLEIISMYSATIPPPLTYTYGTSAPEELQGMTVSFQIFDKFDTLEGIEADDGSGKNVWDIVNPYFQFTVALGVLGVILMDLMALGLPSFSGHKEEEYPKTGKIDVSLLPDQDTPHATYGEPQKISINFKGKRYK